MDDIILDDVPDEMVASLQRRAERNGRCFDDEIRAIVEAAAREPMSIFVTPNTF